MLRSQMIFDFTVLWKRSKFYLVDMKELQFKLAAASNLLCAQTMLFGTYIMHEI